MIQYKIKKFVNSSSSKNGYYYAKAMMLGEVDLDAIAEKIQRNCSMKKSDVKAVLTEMVEVMAEALQDSKKVRINGLGSFKMAIKSELVQKLQDVNSADTIKGFRVRFTPEYKIDQAGQRITALTSGTRTRAYTPYQAGQNDKEK